MLTQLKVSNNLRLVVVVAAQHQREAVFDRRRQGDLGLGRQNRIGGVSNIFGSSHKYTHISRVAMGS